jgi:voltage-gated potassium channel
MISRTDQLHAKTVLAGRPERRGPQAQIPAWGRLAKLLAIGIVIFLVLIMVSSVGYKLIQKDYTWMDAIYMAVITIGEVGYAEMGPRGLSFWGRVWNIFVILTSLVLVTTALSLIVAALVEGRVRDIFGRRQLERKIASLSGHVIVCGYGRMGQVVARDVARAGKDVVVVDLQPERTSEAGEQGLMYVLGDAREEEVLKEANIQRAGCLVATLPDDADNVFLTLSARGLRADLPIFARAQELATQNKLVKAGANRVISPVMIGAGRLADLILRPAMVDFVEMAHRGLNLEMDQLTLLPDSKMVGRTLRELALPAKVGAVVVAILHSDGKITYNPGPDVGLKVGDTLVMVGKRGVAGALQTLDLAQPGT